MDINSQKSTFLFATDCKIENIDKKKVFMHKILQNLKYLTPKYLHKQWHQEDLRSSSSLQVRVPDSWSRETNQDSK